jgi:hypothetical protein
MNIIHKLGRIYSDADGHNCRPIPKLLKVWFYLLAFWSMSQTYLTESLRGIRIGHQFYYIELLFPLVIIHLFLKPKYIKLPKWVLVFGLWLLVMAVVGYFKGYFPSLIYDRSRNWAAMALLLMLLHRYQISSRELIRLLKPVFIAALVGYPLSVLLPPINYQRGVDLRDILGFNFMFGAFAIGDYWTNKRLRWWYVAALCTTFVLPVFLAARAKFIAMISGLLIPVIRKSRRNLLQSTIIIIPIVLIVGAIIILVTPADQFRGKSFRGGGLSYNNLESTSDARFLESVALFTQMQELDYMVGKGAGATWDGSDLYSRLIGVERQNFHIYYFEIFYWYGSIGLLLWLTVGVIPVTRGFIHFQKLDAVGIMGLCSQTTLLMSWFGHAGYSVYEGSYIAVSLYALHCGRTDRQKSSNNLNFL